MIFHHSFERNNCCGAVAMWLINEYALKLNDLKRTSHLWLWQCIVLSIYIPHAFLFNFFVLISSSWGFFPLALACRFRTRKRRDKNGKTWCYFKNSKCVYTFSHSSRLWPAFAYKMETVKFERNAKAINYQEWERKCNRKVEFSVGNSITTVTYFSFGSPTKWK